jgi:hypothetical protein
MLHLKQIAWPILIVMAFAAGFALQMATAQDAPRRTVQQWEYYNLANPQSQHLKLAGEEGWELVTVNQVSQYEQRFYFKRPK